MNLTEIKENLIQRLTNYRKHRYGIGINHGKRASDLVGFIQQAKCGYEMLLMFGYQVKLYGFTEEELNKRLEIARRLNFDNRDDITNRLKRPFNKTGNTMGHFYQCLVDCIKILKTEGYYANVMDRTIYVHTIYVGDRMDKEKYLDAPPENQQQLRPELRKGAGFNSGHVASAKTLCTYLYQTTVNCKIRGVIWYDKTPPMTNLHAPMRDGITLEYKPISELFEKAIEIDTSIAGISPPQKQLKPL
ncbi:hypothetical protein [Dongshaea marina]|uniref:hypothetical protein n=1 Tax=Dongshaea marina TaxID=2047966 RepID=UPI000D3E8355|nr:hypothetical protein [Dongshaea marina]